MQLVARNPIDGYFLRGELDGAPWSIHAEVITEDRLDLARLSVAVEAAVHAHPMARATSRCWDQGRWAIGKGLPVPVTSIDVSSSAAVDDFRDDFISKSFSHVGGEWLVRFALVRAPFQDHFLTVSHHAIIDGIGTLLLAKAVLDAYSDDGFSSRDPDSAWERVRSLPIPLAPKNATAPAMVRQRVRRRCTQVASDGGLEGDTGWGFVHCSFEDPINSLSAIRENDVLLAAFHLAIDRWNADHSLRSDDIGVALTVNLRPHADWYAGLGNASLAWPTRSRAADRKIGGGLIELVAKQAKECRFGIAGSAVAAVAEEFVRRDGQVLWLKKALAETTVVSNMGDLGRALAGNPLHISGMAGSMPPTAAMSVSFYVGRWQNELTIGARFRRDRLSRCSARILTQSIFACYRELSEHVRR
jgi:hypothetical protein